MAQITQLTSGAPASSFSRTDVWAIILHKKKGPNNNETELNGERFPWIGQNGPEGMGKDLLENKEKY